MLDIRQRAFYTTIDSLFVCILLTSIFTQLQSAHQLTATPWLMFVLALYGATLLQKFGQVTEGALLQPARASQV